MALSAQIKLHSFAKLGLRIGLIGFANVCNVRSQKFSKMRSEGFLFFLLYQSYLSFFRLHCWSSRVSPVVKSVCVTICMLFLVIVNVYVVFFSMCPNGLRYETLRSSKHKPINPLNRLLIVMSFKFSTIRAMFYDRLLWVVLLSSFSKYQF